MATGPVRHHRFTYNCWVNSQDRPLSSRTERLLFLVTFFPFPSLFFFFFLEEEALKSSNTQGKLFEGSCRKRCLPPTFPRRTMPRYRGFPAPSCSPHHPPPPPPPRSSAGWGCATPRGYKGMAMVGSCRPAASHRFCLSWGFHTSSPGEPGWGRTVLHLLRPPSPLVIHVHSMSSPGTSTARLGRPFLRLRGTVLAGMGQLMPLALAVLIPGRRDAGAPSLPHCLRADLFLARHGASRYSWRVFNDDGQSSTHRSCCQTCKHGPGFGLMAG